MKVASESPLCDGIIVLSRSICPQPSAELGISAVPKSRAPLISVALMRDALGEDIPPCSLMYSLTSAVAPPAIAVA